ncbi:MAG: pilus assembly protein, partial [Thermoleophilaceae bacterium]
MTRPKASPGPSGLSEPSDLSRRGAQAGQASIELVAMVPVVLLVGAVAWQLALAGHTAWLTAN